MNEKGGIFLRTEKEMISLILSVAKELDVRAVAMSGSRANKKLAKDRFQDYDIVYLIEDKESLVNNRSWLEKFGPRLIMQTPEEMTLFPPSLGERFTFLMLFEDCVRIDLTLCPLSELSVWLQEEPMIKVLSDPEKILAGKTGLSHKSYQTVAATNTVFQDCCNKFWWVSTYVVKGLARREQNYAIDHLYGICQQELLRVLGWQLVQKKGSMDLGKNYKFLFPKLAPEKVQRFSGILNFSNEEQIKESLLETQRFFHEEAQALAKSAGFVYDLAMAEKVIDYTKKIFFELANPSFVI